MIYYVTGNYGKYVSVKERFAQESIPIEFYEYDFKELNINDIGIISKDKVIQAYNILNCPCFVSDSGFYIEDYPDNPNYPGAFVKRSGISSDINTLLKAMQNTNNRTCYFKDCITYYDGCEFHSFYGITKGTLAYEILGDDLKKAKSNLWKVFIPQNCSKTLAQMSNEERNNRNDGHTSALEEFINWYSKINTLKRIK